MPALDTEFVEVENTLSQRAGKGSFQSSSHTDMSPSASKALWVISKKEAVGIHRQMLAMLDCMRFPARNSCTFATVPILAMTTPYLWCPSTSA